METVFSNCPCQTNRPILSLSIEPKKKNKRYPNVSVSMILCGFQFRFTLPTKLIISQ